MSEDEQLDSCPRLLVVRGGELRQEFLLQPGNNLIGRWDTEAGSFPEIDLESEDLDAKISRKHAVIEWTGDVCTLEDLGSLNGTYINRGEKIEPGVRHQINAGDELILGNVVLRFEFNTPAVIAD